MSRAEALIAEALRWYGTKEEGGDNRGPAVETFQKAVDRTASGEPWCMAFCQYALNASGGSDLFPSEHCLTVWEKSPPALRRGVPTSGCLAIWTMLGTTKGHAGIVVLVHREMMVTIEGNTSPGPGIEREGDGVYLKARPISKISGMMQLQGFLWPWLSSVVSPATLR